MRSQKALYLLLLAAVFAFFTNNNTFAQAKVTDLKPTVIIISLDGFRYDYLDKYHPP